jgi:hypothetical protein
MKLCMYIMPTEPILMVHYIIPFLQYYQHYSRSNCRSKILILLERIYQSSWNLVRTSFNMKPSQRCTWYIPRISNTNTIASQILEVIPLILLECFNRLSWELVCISSHLRSYQRRT